MHFEYGEDIGVKGDRIFWGGMRKDIETLQSWGESQNFDHGPKLTHHLVFVVVVNSF